MFTPGTEGPQIRFIPRRVPKNVVEELDKLWAEIKKLWKELEDLRHRDGFLDD